MIGTAKGGTSMPPRRSSTSMARLSGNCSTVGATTTGRNCSDTAAAPASRASLRQPCTMLALIPCAIATLATDAPGTAHLAKICAFRSALWRLRLRLFCLSIMSSYLLTGHDRYRSAASVQDGFAGRVPRLGEWLGRNLSARWVRRALSDFLHVGHGLWGARFLRTRLERSQSDRV